MSAWVKLLIGGLLLAAVGAGNRGDLTLPL